MTNKTLDLYCNITLTPNLNSNCAGTKFNIFTAIASWSPKKTPSLLVAQSEKFGVGRSLLITREYSYFHLGYCLK